MGEDDVRAQQTTVSIDTNSRTCTASLSRTDELRDEEYNCTLHNVCRDNRNRNRTRELEEFAMRFNGAYGGHVVSRVILREQTFGTVEPAVPPTLNQA